MIPTISQADGKKIGKGHRKNHHKELHKNKQKNKLIVIAPRKRVFKNIIVVRPHGHSYHGYGHHLHELRRGRPRQALRVYAKAFDKWCGVY